MNETFHGDGFNNQMNEDMGYMKNKFMSQRLWKNRVSTSHNQITKCWW